MPATFLEVSPVGCGDLAKVELIAIELLAEKEEASKRPCTVTTCNYADAKLFCPIAEKEKWQEGECAGDHCSPACARRNRKD